VSAATNDPSRPADDRSPASTVDVIRPADNTVVRLVWGTLGTFALGLGLIGVVVPGWPTTIFLILATAAYARSSQRMYDRILANRVFGPHVRHFRETGGMPTRAKVMSLAIMWPFVTCSVVFAIPTSMHLVQALILTLALVGTAYIISRPTVEPVARTA
jgi:uncharacterized membrane protein YbaN (DUF454 family)